MSRTLALLTLTMLAATTESIQLRLRIDGFKPLALFGGDAAATYVRVYRGG